MDLKDPKEDHNIQEGSKPGCGLLNPASWGEQCPLWDLDLIVVMIIKGSTKQCRLFSDD